MGWVVSHLFLDACIVDRRNPRSNDRDLILDAHRSFPTWLKTKAGANIAFAGEFNNSFVTIGGSGATLGMVIFIALC